MLWLHAWWWLDLGGGGHLRYLQRPLLGSLLGGDACVLALPIKQSFFMDLGFQDARLAALIVAQRLRQNANRAEVDDAQERFPFL